MIQGGDFAWRDPSNVFMKISIVTPSFNQASHLSETIYSVLGQGVEDLEYLIIDGGSSDGSREIIEKNAEKLSYWCSEPDGGQYEAINKGFAKSTGEIMGWLNSSDLYMPWTLKTVEEIFTQFPEVHWISSMRKVCIRESGAFEWMDEISGFSGRRLARGLHGGSSNGDYIQQETCFWRRSLWEKIGGKLPDRYRYAADFWLWGEFFKHSHCTGVEAPLAGFRFHGDQRSTANQYAEEVVEILKDLNQRDVWKMILPGYQNVIRYSISPALEGNKNSELKLVKYEDDRFYAMIKFWSDLAKKARWTAASITYFPFAAWRYCRRGFRRHK
jgi:glycosyltransferase involved in cell wall biosynthesis